MSRRVVTDLFLFFKKALYEVKASGFWYTSTWTYNKNELYKIQTVDPGICSISNF